MSFGFSASAAFAANRLSQGRRLSEQVPDWDNNAMLGMLDGLEKWDDPLNFVGMLPEERLWIRSEQVRKRTADDTLVTRRIVITDASLYFAHESDDIVLDEILLSDIVQANIVETSNLLSRESHALGGRAPNDTGCDFILVASADGRNNGRAYQLRCSDKAEADDLVKFLREKAQVARERENSLNNFKSYQASVDKWYSSDICQGVVAVLIFSSFVANVIELEIDPGQSNPALRRTFLSVDLFFTVVFSVELLVNMFAKWFWPFWRDYWNIFDFCIVLSSVVALVIELQSPQTGDDNGLVNAVRTIRILRAFRVMRLFGRLENIRKIISALGSSLIPVGNAFVIVLLIAAVYAILGVNVFRSTQPDGFGTWSKGLYTMFSVTTMDGWQELVVMPMIAEQEGSKTVPESLLTAFFFITFVVIVVWTMLPVVVAVLLENFSKATHQEELNSERQKMQKSGLDKMQNTLDPIFDLLSHYSTDLDLSQKVGNLFKVMIGDNAEVETINFREMTAGLHSKKWFQRIHLSREDYDSFTCSGLYGDAQGNLNLKEFEAAMRTQLKRYVQRQVAKQQFVCQVAGQSQTAAMLLSMKLLHMDILSSSRAVRDPQDPTLMPTSTTEKARTGSSSPDTPISPYSTPRPVAQRHAVEEVGEIESVLDGPSQTRSLNPEPPQLNTQLDMRKEMEKRVDPWEERMERIMVDLCASVSKMRGDLAAMNERIEETSRQVEECRLGPLGVDALERA